MLNLKLFFKLINEADFYQRISAFESEEERSVQRQFAGMLWNKQFYYYVVEDWLKAILTVRRHQNHVQTAETMNGFTCLIMTFSQCQTNGNTWFAAWIWLFM